MGYRIDKFDIFGNDFFFETVIISISESVSLMGYRIDKFDIFGNDCFLEAVIISISESVSLMGVNKY
jgi:hypothetical protein